MSTVDTPLTATTAVPSTEVSVENAPEAPGSADAYRALKSEEASEAKTVPVRDREFRIVEQLPGIILLDLGLASDPNATQGEQLRAMRQFLHSSIHPDEVDAFEAFLRNAQPVIEIDELTKLVEVLIEMIAGRPTG